MTTKFILLFFTALLSIKAFAFEKSLTGDALLVGDQRWPHAEGFKTHESLSDGMFIGGLDGAIRYSGFNFEARPEIRALWSDSNRDNGFEVENIYLQGPKRYADLNLVLSKDDREEAYLDFEKLALSYRTEKTEVLVGRKIFSAGVLKLFPVWNKFSRPMPFLPSPLIIYGQDQATATAQVSNFTLRASYLPDANSNLNTDWFELGWLPANFEFHFLGNYWWGVQVYGLSAATDLFGATFRFEGLAIDPTDTKLDKQTQAGFGVERAFSEKWTALYEYYHQSSGVDSMQYSLKLNHFNALQAYDYSAFQLNYKLKETFTVSLAGLLNHDDSSTFLDLKFDDSLTENSNLIFEAKGPISSEGELSSQSVRFANGTSIGLPSQVSLAYKIFF